MISAVSFTGQTKQGNPYHKTSSGRYTGLLAGAGAGALAYAVQKETTLDVMKKYSDEVFKYFSHNQATKFTEQTSKVVNVMNKIPGSAIAITVALFGLSGLGIGVIADAISNRNARKYADKAAKA
jgi:ribosomal protein S17E